MHTKIKKKGKEVLSEIKGVTIIDDDKDVKYVVPNGTHNAWLTYPSYYTVQDRDYIVNTVKEWLK